MFFNLQANFGVISCQNLEKMPLQKYYDLQILLKIKSWSEKLMILQFMVKFKENICL